MLEPKWLRQIVNYLDHCELFLEQCTNDNGAIVPAVPHPDFDCQSYASYQYWKTSNIVDYRNQTLVIYSVIMGLAIIIHVVLTILSIFLYKKLSGTNALVIAPSFSEGQMRPVDGAVTEGTETNDSLRVTTGVPVKRSESSLCGDATTTATTVVVDLENGNNRFPITEGVPAVAAANTDGGRWSSSIVNNNVIAV